MRDPATPVIIIIIVIVGIAIPLEPYVDSLPPVLSTIVWFAYYIAAGAVAIRLANIWDGH